jgi:hypothetical protein
MRNRFISASRLETVAIVGKGSVANAWAKARGCVGFGRRPRVATGRENVVVPRIWDMLYSEILMVDLLTLLYASWWGVRYTVESVLRGGGCGMRMRRTLCGVVAGA